MTTISNLKKKKEKRMGCKCEEVENSCGDHDCVWHAEHKCSGDIGCIKCEDCVWKRSSCLIFPTACCFTCVYCTLCPCLSCKKCCPSEVICCPKYITEEHGAPQRQNMIVEGETYCNLDN